MNKSFVIFIALIAILAAILAIVLSSARTAPGAQDGASPGDEGSASNASETVRMRAIELGLRLKNVSLLAPQAELEAQMVAEYGDFLTPELLAKWQADPSTALGRSVSSPWPHRIEVTNTFRQSDTSYRVEGNVIEVTSADRPMDFAALYPVTLHFEKRGDAWLVSSAEKGAYAEKPQRIEVIGVTECLPHRNTDGPQTLECAFGIAADQGVHYAVDLSMLAATFNFETGRRVRAEGVLIAENAQNKRTFDIYDIKGILGVASISEI